MPHARHVVYGFAAAALLIGQAALAQDANAPRKYKAPTVADWTALGKLPDLTGVWEIPMGGGGRAGAGRGGAPAAPGGRAGAPGGGFGFGRGRGPQPQLTPEYAAKAKEEAAAAGPGPEDNQTANCLPPGMPAIMGQPYPIEILMTPGLVTVVIEAYNQIRHIHTDGRPLPDDPDPSFYGTSVGHWEGNTLVVESAGFEPVPRGLNFPYSDKMKIVEKFSLSDPDTLNIETTIQDPLALIEPFSMGNRVFRRHRSWTIAEYICEENNRNFVDDKGKAGINLSKPTAAPR